MSARAGQAKPEARDIEARAASRKRIPGALRLITREETPMARLARATVAVLAVVALGAGCVQRPVLYPNAKLEDGGKAEAAGDIAYCRELANEHVSSGGAKAKEIGKDTAVGAVGGAGIGAVAGAVSGGGAGRGAGIGAAVGATAGLLTGAIRSAGPGPIYKGFVDRCLSNMGYQVIGWQ
jgi:outer membrane lipoprotein SlyB